MAKAKNSIDKIVPDTSVIIEGLLSRILEKKELEAKEIVIHEAVLAELEHQANDNKAKGFLGLTELTELRKLSTKLGFGIRFSGKRPSVADIKYAKLGEIDSLIRDLAFDESATLITADKVQARCAEAKDIQSILIKPAADIRKLKLEKFFDSTTMSVHLRENTFPYAKKGVPGNWQFTPVRATNLTRDEVQEISGEIIEEAGMRRDGFVEIERPGSTIVQLGNFRIVITKPPFSDGWEITAVRPVKKLSLEDYKLSEKLQKRIAEQAEGILIAGSPGMGKSTFAQALAEHYASQERIVKTIEAPRDLMLGENVTQYAISHGDAQEIHDILLLSRPDNTLFDEMRNTADFKLFADLRLAGIGLAGVVHATNPIDAIQRFVGRIELGVIPQVIDTVIFIKNGAVDKVLNLQMVVKVPAGMTEADLARPVVVVSDFETKKSEFELYSYGEETVVVPVRGEAGKTPSQKLAEKTIQREFTRYADEAQVDVVGDNKVVVSVPSHAVAAIIGKQGSNIKKIEERLGISVDIQEMKEGSAGHILPYEVSITKRTAQFRLDSKAQFKDVEIYVNGDYLLSAKVGKSGVLKVHRSNKIGRILIDAINTGEEIEIRG
jgi:ATPase